jgi:hypothetical protein
MRQPHSFDIFDTLLARRCVEPKNVFHELEQRANLPGFAEQRIRAERIFWSDGATYGLDDIYAALQSQFGYEPEVAARLKKLEVELEIDNAIPIRENLDRVRDGDILVTDMYLPRSAILRLLDKVGLRKQVGLVISSAGKHSGKVWAGLNAAMRIEQHVGDNAHSDVHSPLESGIFAEHLTTSGLSQHETFLRNEGFELLARAVREVRLTQISHHLGRERVLQRSLQINNNIPILLLSSVILKLLTKKIGISKILFSSRDCYYFSRMFSYLSNKAGWDIPSEYFYTSRLARIGSSTSYLRYFQSIVDEDALVVDLCGTGWSLGQLYRRAGIAPRTFLLHELKNKPDLMANYATIRESSDIPTLCLIGDAALNNGCLEMANYVDHGMAVDVKVIDGYQSVIPQFEDPDYPANVTTAIREIEAAQDGFLAVLERIDVVAMVNEIERNLDKVENTVLQLYRDLCANMDGMHDIAAYHARQDRKSMWKLKKEAA